VRRRQEGLPKRRDARRPRCEFDSNSQRPPRVEMAGASGTVDLDDLSQKSASRRALTTHASDIAERQQQVAKLVRVVERARQS
jgi:hypothetical protein